jgi:hypothetical protein
MFQRYLLKPILAALADTPVVFLRGARQSGKSTLVQTISNGPYPCRYVTLDNAGFLTSAGADPTGFIAGLEKPVIIDEAQRVPGLFLAIKEEVDRNRLPGQYLLTGSADPLALPAAARELVGRMEVKTLWPLSTAELMGTAAVPVESFFSADFPKGLRADTAFDLAAAMVAGGFPEPFQRKEFLRRAAWFESYITTILDRDVRHLSQIQDLTSVPRLLQLLAGRSAALHNQSEVSRAAAIPNSTLSRYMGLLKSTFLIQDLPAWSANLGKRLVKAPKLFIVDTGLACHLLALDERRIREGGEIAGRMFENFVVLELFKQLSWAAVPLRLHHFRSQAGKEVDVVIEAPDGRVVGLEIKLSATPSTRDFSGLKTLKDNIGGKWVRGLLIYTGREVVPFGKDLHAVPVSALFTPPGG